MLGAAKGCEIEIAASGKEAEGAVSALSELVAEGFGENDPQDTAKYRPPGSSLPAYPCLRLYKVSSVVIASAGSCYLLLEI
ncbi:MAG: HPr family phosphocarrier protein [Rhodobiaceae bacterium]|nr:HPr family phosphocarrier protein [Rhodobiaceae bacterium]